MRLHSIELKNYRCYQEFSVNFHPKFNVVAGVNGSGKTSLLKAAREALNGYVNYIPQVPQEAPLTDPRSSRIQQLGSGTRARFDEQYPVWIRATGTAFGQTTDWELMKISQANPGTWSGKSPGAVWGSLTFGSLEPIDGRQSQMILPLVAFYPAYRQWPPIETNQMAAATMRPARTDGYSNWTDAAAFPVALQQWAVTKSLERLQRIAAEGVRWDDMFDDELAQVNLALAAVVEDAKGLRYDFSEKSLVMDWAGDRQPTLFQNLSDGQRVAIALVTDIARRMCLLNPHLGQDVTLQTPGVVLIDELDVHLHPKWQRQIAKGLKAAFPEIQFIAASHSPQILGELPPEEIILLDASGIAGHPEVSYGLDSSRVLEQIMGAEPRAAAVEAVLSELFTAIERLDLVQARDLLSDLKKSAPGIPELAGAEALLRRKEALRR